MNPLQISKDTNFNRIIDAAVLLVIGMVVGVMSAQFVAFYETETTTSIKTIKRVPLRSSDTNSEADAPADTIWFEQI